MRHRATARWRRKPARAIPWRWRGRGGRRAAAGCGVRPRFGSRGRCGGPARRRAGARRAAARDARGRGVLPRRGARRARGSSGAAGEGRGAADLGAREVPACLVQPTDEGVGLGGKDSRLGSHGAGARRPVGQVRQGRRGGRWVAPDDPIARKRKLGAQGPEISVVGYGAWEAGGTAWGANESEDVVIDAMRAGWTPASTGSIPPRSTATVSPRRWWAVRSRDAETRSSSRPRLHRSRKGVVSRLSRSGPPVRRAWAGSGSTVSTSTSFTGRMRAGSPSRTRGERCASSRTRG